MKHFMFYVGGDCGNSNVELHDVRFSVGETPQDSSADLRRQWWGDAKSLHLAGARWNRPMDTMSLDDKAVRQQHSQTFLRLALSQAVYALGFRWSADAPAALPVASGVAAIRIARAFMQTRARLMHLWP